MLLSSWLGYHVIDLTPFFTFINCEQIHTQFCHPKVAIARLQLRTLALLLIAAAGKAPTCHSKGF